MKTDSVLGKATGFADRDKIPDEKIILKIVSSGIGSNSNKKIPNCAVLKERFTFKIKNKYPS